MFSVDAAVTYRNSSLVTKVIVLGTKNHTFISNTNIKNKIYWLVNQCQYHCVKRAIFTHVR